MCAVVLSFVLKLSFHSFAGMAATAAAAALFVGLTWESAISQSKTQISDWLENPQLMLDIAVLLTVDVALLISFCFLRTRKLSGERLSVPLRRIEALLFWFPGILIFPVLFAMLVEVIFSASGVEFALVGWSTACAVLLLAPALAYFMRWLLPLNSMRLELLFLDSLVIAALGVVATVNGRTQTAGVSHVEWGALARFFVILAVGAAIGLAWSRLRRKPRI